MSWANFISQRKGIGDNPLYFNGFDKNAHDSSVFPFVEISSNKTTSTVGNDRARNIEQNGTTKQREKIATARMTVEMGKEYNFSIPQNLDFYTGVHLKITIPCIQIRVPGEPPARIRWNKNIEERIVDSAEFSVNEVPMDYINKEVLYDYRKHMVQYIKVKQLNLEPFPIKHNKRYELTLKKITIKIPLRFWFTQKPLNKNAKLPGMASVSCPYGQRFVRVRLSGWGQIIEREEPGMILDHHVYTKEEPVIAQLIIHGGFITNELHDAYIKNPQLMVCRSFIYKNPRVHILKPKRGDKFEMNMQKIQNGRCLVEFLIIRSPVKIKDLSLDAYGSNGELEYYRYSRKRQQHVYILDRRLSPLDFGTTGTELIQFTGTWNSEKHEDGMIMIHITMSQVRGYKVRDGHIEWV